MLFFILKKNKPSFTVSIELRVRSSGRLDYTFLYFPWRNCSRYSKGRTRMEYHFTQILQPCWELMKVVDLVKIPRVSQTITCPVPGGRFPELNVCGHDYPTKDGNGAFEKASDKVTVPSPHLSFLLLKKCS